MKCFSWSASAAEMQDVRFFAAIPTCSWWKRILMSGCLPSCNASKQLHNECVCVCVCCFGEHCVLLCFDTGLTVRSCWLYLSTRRVASAGPCGGSLCGAVWALGRQPATAVRVAEALAVLFADLHEQTNISMYVDLPHKLKQAAFVVSVNSSRWCKMVCS